MSNFTCHLMPPPLCCGIDHLAARCSLLQAVIVFDVRLGTKYRVLQGHTGDVTAVAFSPADPCTTLVSYSHNEQPQPTIRVWTTVSWLTRVLGRTSFLLPGPSSH